MLSGPPLPLPQHTPLHQLLAFARPPGTLGAWVRGSVLALHLYDIAGGGPHRLLVGPDLGHLLGRCRRIALRAGTALVVLEADTVIRWRVLQVITATPHLPSLEWLNEIFPGAHPTSSGFDVGVSGCAPEHVLAQCLAQGIPVRESRIAYRVGGQESPVDAMLLGRLR
jgi:hypothetical protein